ncbi:MAG: histidine phosphatase family protein [Bauldia sp.]|nr:histidine phosphatase family protein [Bauldia sp.]
MLPPIVFLRHGETAWNAEGRLQGQRDIPLNDRGRAQARRNGEAIFAARPEIAGYDFVASPLSRARETMEIARLAMRLDPSAYRLEERVQELTFGEWEGFTTGALRVALPDLLQARERDKWTFVPPGGESYAHLLERVLAWLNTVEKPTFLVSHGGVGRVLRAHLLGVSPHQAASEDFPQDRVLIFENGASAWV